MTIFNASLFWLAAILLVFSVVFRIKIYRASSASAVDSHYWILAAKAYREQRSLPVKISNKYILESEIQAYPPFFGMLLGRFLPISFVPYATLIIEGLQIFLLVLTMYFIKIPAEAIFLACAFFVSAPILAIYNAQLTSRALGDLFLSCALVFQIIAGIYYVGGYQALFFWMLSSLMIGLMLMTHKMTYQLYLVLLPFFLLSLNTLNVLYAGFLGLVLYISFVGLEFSKIQFKAHWEIVCFWHKHWPNLGAHQFKDSPLYGEADMDRSSFFHQPGWHGIIKHLRVVIAYAPICIFLPICSLVSGVWPPVWLLVWFSVTYGWILLTLFNSHLKRFGGGHLYVFNVVVPATIYVAFLPVDEEAIVYLLALASALTLLALYFGWRTVLKRPIGRDVDFDDLIQKIQTWGPTRFAVFPLQAAEPVAEKTQHAVLWGAHGLGFDRLEGFFPVLTKPLAEFIIKYKIEWVLWDSRYWPKGEEIMKSEGILCDKSTSHFGRWRLSQVQNIS